MNKWHDKPKPELATIDFSFKNISCTDVNKPELEELIQTVDFTKIANHKLIENLIELSPKIRLIQGLSKTLKKCVHGPIVEFMSEGLDENEKTCLVSVCNSIHLTNKQKELIFNLFCVNERYELTIMLNKKLKSLI